MTTAEMRAAIEAFERDKKVRYRARGTDDQWYETSRPLWNFDVTDYSPVPKPRELWANVYGDGSRMYHESPEKADRQASPTRVECIHYREVFEDDDAATRREDEK